MVSKHSPFFSRRMKTQAIWSRGQRVILGMVMRMLVAGGCVEHTAVGLSAAGVSIKH